MYSCLAVRDAFPRLFAVFVTIYVSLIENFGNFYILYVLLRITKM